MKWIAGGLFTLAAAVVIAAALISTPMRQQVCIAAVEARDPIVYSEVGTGGYEKEPQFVSVKDREEREAELAEC